MKRVTKKNTSKKAKEVTSQQVKGDYPGVSLSSSPSSSSKGLWEGRGIPKLYLSSSSDEESDEFMQPEPEPKPESRWNRCSNCFGASQKKHKRMKKKPKQTKRRKQKQKQKQKQTKRKKRKITKRKR